MGEMSNAYFGGRLVIDHGPGMASEEATKRVAAALIGTLRNYWGLNGQPHGGGQEIRTMIGAYALDFTNGNEVLVFRSGSTELIFTLLNEGTGEIQFSLKSWAGDADVTWEGCKGYTQ